MNKCVDNESFYMFEFKQRVKDCYLQVWTESVNKNSNISLFMDLEITPESYLSSIKDGTFISVIDKCRCSSHGLAIEF